MIINSRKSDVSQVAAGSSERSSIASGYMPSGSAAYGQNKDSSQSVVDPLLTMKGDLESDGDVLVKGKVIGNIKCKMLMIDVGASVEGGINVNEVVIRGAAKGTIIAHHVRLEKTAVVDCEMQHVVFSAEEGARIKGTLRFKDEAETPRAIGVITVAA